MKKLFKKFLKTQAGKIILSVILSEFKQYLIKKVLVSKIPVSAQTMVIEFLNTINDEFYNDFLKNHDEQP